MSAQILVLSGSPRKNGNSIIASKRLLDHAQKMGMTGELIDLYCFNIEACIDCRACMKNEKICQQKDDMQNLYTKIDNADVIVFATPIYWFAANAKTKLVIDRFRPYFYNKKLQGKKLILLMSAGNGKSDCDLTEEMFKRICLSLNINYLGAMKAKAYDEGEIQTDKSALAQIDELIYRI